MIHYLLWRRFMGISLGSSYRPEGSTPINSSMVMLSCTCNCCFYSNMVHQILQKEDG